MLWGERLRRPEGLVAQTRWLFTLLALVSVLLSLPGLFASPDLFSRLIDAAAYIGLLAVWSYRYLSGRAPVLLGALEAALVLATSVAGPDPASRRGLRASVPDRARIKRPAALASTPGD